eukprot:gene3839-5256_t
MTDKRTLLRDIFDAAVAAAHPDKILGAHLPAPPTGRIICLAAGKAAAAMAAAAEAHYLDTLGLEPSRLTGIATTRHGHGVPTRRIAVIEAGHPVPDEAGLKGADASLKLAATATADDLLLVLISGGGSANWIAPVDGITFQQKQQVTRALLRSGAAIGEINTVRKHLSRIKGGRLARAGQRAEILTLDRDDADQKACQHRAADRSHSADHGDHKGFREDVGAHFGDDPLQRRGEQTGKAGDRRADAEHVEPDLGDVDAEHPHDLRIARTGADDKTEAGFLKEQPCTSPPTKTIDPTHRSRRPRPSG